jgi:hypothetical protein
LIKNIFSSDNVVVGLPIFDTKDGYAYGEYVLWINKAEITNWDISMMMDM